MNDDARTGIRPESPVPAQASGAWGSDAIAGALQRISQLATDYPEIRELDINPFIVGPVGTTAYVADARMTLSNDAAIRGSHHE